jgi:thioredoxin 1
MSRERMGYRRELRETDTSRWTKRWRRHHADITIYSMPTFLILKGTSVVETVRGANPTALRTAILSAAASAARGPAKSSASFTGKGQALGSNDGKATGATSRTVSGPAIDFSALIASPATFAQGRGTVNAIVRFVGLYISTLFSLEPAKTAAESPFAVRTRNGQRVG